MKLFVRSYGEGYPLLILHGMFEMSDNWVLYAKHWAKKYKVIIPDLRNHGRSPHSPELTYEAMARDIKELLDELGIEKTKVVGFSMGGRLAMYMAQKYPGLFEKMVIIDISPREYTESEFFKQLTCVENFRKLVHFDPSQYKTRQEVEQALKEFLPNPKLTPLIVKNIKHENGKFAWKVNIKAIEENFDKLREQVIAPNKKITVPTLFVKAGNSHYIGDKDKELLEKTFENYKIETIEKASHFLPIEKPEVLKKIIDGYFEE